MKPSSPIECITGRKMLTKRMLIMLGAVLVLVLVLALGFFLHIRKLVASAPKPTPQTVTTAVVRAQEWQPQLTAPGTLTAVQGVDISSEVVGQVRHINFQSGQDVRQGDILIQLNAEADSAQLHSLQAGAELATVTFKRDQALLNGKSVSQAQVDSAAADLKEKTALVSEQAALLAKKTIRAPFSGRLGITTINPGQYLNPGDKIVTLQAINSLYVNFYLPQRDAGSVMVGQTVNIQNDAYANETFHGKITAISPKIDMTTRNIQVQATVDNPQHKLLPGMSVVAFVQVGQKQSRLTLPQTAITYNPYGSIVFIVNKAAQEHKENKKDIQGSPVTPDLEVQQTFVVTGETRGDQVAITSGLQEGQEVVTSGQMKLKNGTAIVVDNSVVPADSPNPAPQEH